ncbi:MAG: LuxR family transcriptional regulator [Oscillospiraceae bacterium]|nr:LuxR family transcriptional regulator [Oscillospiraceae bacterium]
MTTHTQEKQLEILNFLFGDFDNNFNSTVFVGCLNRGAMAMREMKYPIRNVLKIADLNFAGSCDYYVTANSLKCNRPRHSDQLFGLHNICIDIDLHNSDGSLSQKIFDDLRYFIVHDFELPLPNVFVRTGRGVQLWWHFAEASSKLLFMYQSITQLIINRLNDIISAVDTLSGFNIDTTASRNVVGYFRLPFTFNTKSRTMATAEFLTEEVYNLVELFEGYCYDVHSIAHSSVVATSLQIQPHPQIGSKQYISLVRKRKKFLEDYCANRDYNIVGSRDLVMFLYCATIYNLVGVNYVMLAMQQLNSRFTTPLRQSHLDSIYNYVVSKGGLRFTNANFLDYLPFLTNLERISYNTVKTTNATRDAKRKTAREERNRKIMELATQGMTTQQIAYTVGCSDKTVRTFLKSQGFSYSELIKEQVRELARQGKNLVSISKELNIPYVSIKKYSK